MTEYKHKPIHWKNLLGNPYRKGLFPELLHGCAIRSFQGKTTGMGKSELDIFLVVTFDEKYLINYLVNKVFKPLQITEHTRLNLLQRAIGKAYRAYQQELKSNEEVDEHGD